MKRATVDEAGVTKRMVFDKPVSDLALLTAAGRAKESERSDRIVNDPLARKLATELGMGLLKQFPQIFADIEAITTKVFDDWISQFVAEGGTQVVVIGAGVDARPYRLEILRGRKVQWWEVDYESIISYKEKVLEGDMPLCSLARVAVDIRTKELPLILEREGLDLKKRILWLAEGVFQYFSEGEVRNVLRTIRKISVDGSCVLFSALSNSTKSHTEQYQGTMVFLKDMGAPLTFKLDSPQEFLETEGLVNNDVIFTGHTSAHYGRLPWPPASEPPEGYPTHWYIKCYLGKQQLHDTQTAMRNRKPSQT